MREITPTLADIHIPLNRIKALSEFLYPFNWEEPRVLYPDQLHGMSQILNEAVKEAEDLAFAVHEKIHAEKGGSHVR